MSTDRKILRLIQRLLAAAAAAFGLATLVVGGRVLMGFDPGYVVFRPLLFYNTAMGAAYLAAGVMTWLSLERGRLAAATIFVLNLLVLGFVGYLYANGQAVAIESIRAMTFRTGVWLALFLALAWLSRRASRAPRAR